MANNKDMEFDLLSLELSLLSISDLFTTPSFNVTDKKARHWLVFYDRSTKKPLAKLSIDNAKSDLKEIAKQKTKKKKS